MKAVNDYNTQAYARLTLRANNILVVARELRLDRDTVCHTHMIMIITLLYASTPEATQSDLLASVESLERIAHNAIGGAV